MPGKKDGEDRPIQAVPTTPIPLVRHVCKFIVKI